MEPEQDTPAPHIGEKLRVAREARGETHAQISEILKVQSSFLDAIERLDSEALPSIGYVLGYVRAYAGYLGLNGQDAVNAYKVDSQIPKNLGRRNIPHFVPKREIRAPRGFFAATTVLSCAAVLAFWYGSQTDAQSAALSSPSGFSTADTQSPEPSEIDPDLMTIKAIAPSWVQIKDKDGQVVISRILIAGETYKTDVDAGIFLSARDSGALELYIGAERMGSLGRKGIPMKDIPMPAVPRHNLDTDAAAALEAANAETEKETDPESEDTSQ